MSVYKLPFSFLPRSKINVSKKSFRYSLSWYAFFHHCCSKTFLNCEEIERLSAAPKDRFSPLSLPPGVQTQVVPMVTFYLCSKFSHMENNVPVLPSGLPILLCAWRYVSKYPNWISLGKIGRWRHSICVTIGIDMVPLRF
jgi:hypothetical protein